MEMFESPHGNVPNSYTLQPTITGTSVMAVIYDGGVAMVTDRDAAYGHTRRYMSMCRQYRVNENVVVGFSGDYADFQWLQNVIERQEEDIKTYHTNTKLTAKGLWNYLTTLLYYRRSQMNPIWNTLVVAGMQPEPTYDNLVPFIGVITNRGVAYETKAVATAMGQMILTETMQRDARARDFKYNRDEALDLLAKMVEIMKYRDTSATGDYDITTVDAQGVTLHKPKKVIGNWDVAHYDNQY
ncbi:Proteasome subunit beta [Aphelenchoides besseyi]|nr:Proteasome subunit beta [Aphelenchoides besseyi]KAI6209033.1 Proteasome subunit beta [Aphelenchoides besseyi]